MFGPILLLAGFFLLTCGPSVEDLIERLDSSGEELDRAKQELLLSKGDAVPVLLKAFDDRRHTAARPELGEVLVGLMTRAEDPRIATALKRHLLTDPDPRVRARIARELGLYKRVEFADAFIQALQDTSDEGVRGEVMKAVGLIKDKLDADKKEVLYEMARLLQDHEDLNTRIEARILVADRVQEWLTEARTEELKGQVVVAESLFHEALAYSPRSKKANLRLGRFFYYNGQRDRGLQVLRESGWLLDVPHVRKAPKLDGRLDDEIWRQAAKASPFFTWGKLHNADMIAERLTEVYVMYTDQALYFGAYCEEAHTESLKVQSHERDHADEWNQDMIEFFLDTNFDLDTSYKITINTVGAIADCAPGVPSWKRDFTWSTESDAAAYVGEDFWSMEYELVLGKTEFPKPHPGTLWSCRMSRSYRGNQWSQWTRTFPGGKEQEFGGWLLFE